MILILFDSYKDAKDGFDVFVSYLEECEPWSILLVEEFANLVKTDSDLTYIFIDRMYTPVYNYFKPDLIGDYEFFEGLEENYIF